MNACGFFISLVWRNVPLRHDDGLGLQRWSDFINRVSTKYKRQMNQHSPGVLTPKPQTTTSNVELSTFNF
jgi:hypothetical protein